ncbi:hypothetical protein AJ87_20420 [Rhizobium yanglingense]|nr:hypothetical protein AJ87_20420 [Rhizobium yanglingense]
MAGSRCHSSRCRARLAGNDREIQRTACFADAFYGFDELAHNFRLLRIAEIEVVGRSQRLGSRRGDIAPAFGDGLLAAFERIGLDITRRDIGREGERLGRMAFDADNAGVAARKLQRIALDQRIVLFVDPAAAGLVGRADELQQRLTIIVRC